MERGAVPADPRIVDALKRRPRTEAGVIRSQDLKIRMVLTQGINNGLGIETHNKLTEEFIVDLQNTLTTLDAVDQIRNQGESS